MVRGGRGGVAVRLDGVGGKAVDGMNGKVYQSKNPKYAGHTAGPWEKIRHEMALVKKNTFDMTICRIYSGEEIPEYESDANIALIADAPFLACEVERLRELCGEMVGLCETFDVMISGKKSDRLGGWDYDYIREKLSAALAKAKGGDR